MGIAFRPEILRFPANRFGNSVFDAGRMPKQHGIAYRLAADAQIFGNGCVGGGVNRQLVENPRRAMPGTGRHFISCHV